MLRLVLAGAVIALIAAGCGGGDSPTQTMAQNGSSGSEATAVPTSTVAQEGSGGSDLTEAKIAAYCGEISDWREGEDELETFGEAAQRLARLLPVLEDVTPPDELKGYHSALVAIYKYSYDFYRSGDANTPLEEAADHSDRELVAVLYDFNDATGALGREPYHNCKMQAAYSGVSG